MQIDELGDLIRQLHKIDSKIQAGQIIAAFRENRRIIAFLEGCKKELLVKAEANLKKADEIPEETKDE